jgi:hypothetical protein
MTPEQREHQERIIREYMAEREEGISAMRGILTALALVVTLILIGGAGILLASCIPVIGK